MCLDEAFFSTFTADNIFRTRYSVRMRAPFEISDLFVVGCSPGDVAPTTAAPAATTTTAAPLPDCREYYVFLALRKNIITCFQIFCVGYVFMNREQGCCNILSKHYIFPFLSCFLFYLYNFRFRTKIYLP